MNVQPFANVVWTYKIHGKYVKQALEQSLRRSDWKAVIPQVAGMINHLFISKLAVPTDVACLKKNLEKKNLPQKTYS